MRKPLNGRYFHAIARGNGKQIIFEDTRDYERFLKILVNALDGSGVNIHAYCLMPNHVHFLFEGELSDISKVMKRLCSPYAMYFNTKYERAGHLFQGRFRSEGIADESHYYTAVRYILRNPQKAGIARADKYMWSSYDAYFEGSEKDKKGSSKVSKNVDEIPKPSVTTNLIKQRFPKKEDYREFILGNDFEGRTYLEDFMLDYDRTKCGEAFRIDKIKEKLGIESFNNLRSLPKAERNEHIASMRNEGLSVRQIERLTGISRGIIQKVTKSVRQ